MESGILVGVGIVAIFIALSISSAFLLWGARIVGIGNRSFGKALGTIVLSGIATSFLSLILSFFPILGFILGFVVSALIMMPIFKTTFWSAVGATLIAWILSIVVIGGIVLLVVFSGIISLSDLMNY